MPLASFSDSTVLPNCFKGNVWKTSERLGRGAYGLFRAHRYHLELNRRTQKALTLTQFVVFQSSLLSLCQKDSVRKPEPLKREKKKKAEAESNRGPSAFQPTDLPLGQTSCELSGEVTDVMINVHKNQTVNYGWGYVVGEG